VPKQPRKGERLFSLPLAHFDPIKKEHDKTPKHPIRALSTGIASLALVFGPHFTI
jgi:hypothetical protein